MQDEAKVLLRRKFVLKMLKLGNNRSVKLLIEAFILINQKKKSKLHHSRWKKEFIKIENYEK